MQLALSLFDPPDLQARLRAHGLPLRVRVTLHANRRVMVSIGRTGVFRVHRGYAAAPDEVVAALAWWARPRISRAERRAAARVFLAYPLLEPTPPASRARRPEPAEPGDDARLARLRAAHSEMNVRHFGAALAEVDIRLSGRMRRKLGHYEAASDGLPAIVISRRHLRRDGCAATLETLLHEMIHQWQDESGLAIDHGRRFRQEARRVGISPRATAMRDR